MLGSHWPLSAAAEAVADPKPEAGTDPEAQEPTLRLNAPG